MNHYSDISKLFVYPDKELANNVGKVVKLISNNYKNLTGQISEFEDFVKTNTINDLEEYYLNTFQINGICSMDIGYILFGEDYKRGDFLAKIQHEQNATSNDTGIELADHLPNILTLLPKTEDKDLAVELAHCLLVPALEEIIKKFENRENKYEIAFNILLSILKEDFKNITLEQYKIKKKEDCSFTPEYACGNDFLKQI